MIYIDIYVYGWTIIYKSIHMNESIQRLRA